MSRHTSTDKQKKCSETDKTANSGADAQIGLEEKLHLTQYSIDHFTESAIWTDLDAHIIYVNDAACRMLGYSRSELLTMTIPDIDVNHDLEKFASFVRSIKRDLSTTFESGHLTRDGRVIPVEISANYLKFDHREYIVSFCRDIAGRKQAEEALRDSEERFRSLVENINDMVWELDSNFTCTYASPRSRDIMGYSPEEILGKKPFDFVYQEDLPVVVDTMVQAFNDRRSMKLLEYRVVRKDGRVITLETNGELILGSDGVPRGYRGINRDITERKAVEETLRRNEQFLSRIFESFQDGISILDKDLNIIRVNHILEEWHRYMLPMKGKKCYAVFHCRTAPCEVCPSMRAMKLNAMQSDVVPLHGQHGEQLGWLEIHSFPLTDDKGKVIGVIEHVRDITRRKNAEDELEDAKSRAELYLDLMSHDINNMNQVGLGFLELLFDSPRLGAAERELLTKSMGSLESSTRLIQNVQKLQKIRSGEMRDQEMDLGEILERVRSYYTRLQCGGHINYQPVSDCKVMANGLLFDVFSNLVGNAIKHSIEKGHPEVTIRLDKVREIGKVYCRVAVEDMGPGIPDELKTQVFNRLRRGHTKAMGKGIGLYLVKSLVESYDGKVWVEDRVPGDHTKGTRFVVLLPAVE